ncbi:MAG TPA: MerR family transcriptional regulator [Pseudonocardia sp.]
MTGDPRDDPARHQGSSTPAPSGGLSLSAVSRQTGISVETLQLWQSRYGLGPALTAPDGDRRYTAGDLQRVRRVHHLVSEGLTTSEAVHAVLGAARSELGLPPDVDPLAHHIGAAALELDGPTVRRLIDEHLRRGDVADTWEAVLRPVLVAIGDRWARLSLGAAVEHLVSHIVIELLTNAISGRKSYRADNAAAAHAATRPVDGVVLACTPGELHDLPLLVLDATLRPDGIITTRIAAPTAGTTLDEAVARLRRPVIALNAMAPVFADPAVFDGRPAGSTLLALGPGWQPEQLPPGVAHVNTLAGARERIASLVGVRVESRPGPRLDTGTP